MSQSEVIKSVDRALQVWAKDTPLRFTRITDDTADIVISFVRRREYKYFKEELMGSDIDKTYHLKYIVMKCYVVMKY